MAMVRWSACKQSRTWTISLLVLVGWIVGCQRHPPVAPARGHVSVEGRPLSGGRVMFLPLGGGKPAMGSIDAQGGFVLGTYRAQDGALVGQHRATIIGPLQGSDDHGKRFVYRPPQGMTFEVRAGEVNQFEFNISSKDGWLTYSDN